MQIELIYTYFNFLIFLCGFQGGGTRMVTSKSKKLVLCFLCLIQLSVKLIIG